MKPTTLCTLFLLTANASFSQSLIAGSSLSQSDQQQRQLGEEEKNELGKCFQDFFVHVIESDSILEQEIQDKTNFLSNERTSEIVFNHLLKHAGEEKSKQLVRYTRDLQEKRVSLTAPLDEDGNALSQDIENYFTNRYKSNAAHHSPTGWGIQQRAPITTFSWEKKL